MSYNYLVIQDYPRHFFPLGTGGTAYADSVGNAATTVTGTPATSVPLVVGGGNSLVFTSGANFRFATSLFAEAVSRPFTIEAWFKPISVTGPVNLVGHNTLNDGLRYDGEKITFGTAHGAAGTSIATYYPENIDKAFYAVGVHTASRNELYVDGVLVAAADVTEEQRLFGYTTDPNAGFLYVGTGTYTGSVVMDSIAVYSSALSSRQVKLHFLWGRDARDFRSVVVSRGGSYWTMTDDTVDVGFSATYDSSEDWQNAAAARVVVTDDGLLPVTTEEGVTVESVWETGMLLPVLGGTYDGSKISWVYDGNVTVQTSVDDGATWTTAFNGLEIPGISTGFNPVDKSLLIRATFPAGETNSISRLRSLSITFYRSRISTSPQSSIVLDPVAPATFAEEIHQPIEHFDRAGAMAGQVLAVNGESEVVRVIELWVRPTVLDATTRYLVDLGGGIYARVASGNTLQIAGMTAIVNGTSRANASTSALNVGQLNHVVLILSANHTGNFTLLSGADGSGPLSSNLAMLATYPTTMTAAQATDLYNAYIGKPSLVVVDSSVITVRDSVDSPVKIYSYDWSVVGSG